MTAAALDRLLAKLTRDLLYEAAVTNERAQALIREALVKATAVRATPLPKTLDAARHEAFTAIRGGLRCTQDSYSAHARHVIDTAVDRLAEAALAIGREQAADAVRLHQAAVEGRGA